MFTDFEGTVPEGHVLFSKQTVQSLMQGLHYLPVIPLNFASYQLFERSSVDFHTQREAQRLIIYLWLQILDWSQ